MEIYCDASTPHFLAIDNTYDISVFATLLFLNAK